MTEHERRVNDKDIKAFENNEQKIHSYLPGQKSNEVTVQDKYLNKLFTNSQMPGQSPEITGSPQQSYFNMAQGPIGS